jgi:nucleoid DNA-binding protein
MTNDIVKILMERDGLSASEAHELVKETVSDIEAALDNNASTCDIEGIFMSNLGLEPDYLFDIM